jgi:hypothetical protein
MQLIWALDWPVNRALEVIRSGALPLIDPGGAERRSRWDTVIRWYAERFGVNSLANCLQECSTRSAMFIAVGDPVVEAARLLARLEGHGDCVLTVRDIGAALAIAERGTTLVAPSSNIAASDLQDHPQSTRRLARLFIGQDVAAVHFLVMKTVLRAAGIRRKSGFAFVSQPLNRITIEQAGIIPQESPLSEDALRVALNGDEDTLVLHAHGEGGHINLGRVVLCGVANQEERVGRRALVDGCRAPIEPSQLRDCRRARTADVVAWGAETIRKSTLLILSCGSLGLAPQLFFSRNSIMLALIDGYACEIGCIDRLVVITDACLARVSSAISGGVQVSSVAAVMNHAATLAQTPESWICVGGVGPEPLLVDAPAGVASNSNGSCCRLPGTSLPSSISAIAGLSQPDLSGRIHPIFAAREADFVIDALSHKLRLAESLTRGIDRAFIARADQSVQLRDGIQALKSGLVGVQTAFDALVYEAGRAMRMDWPGDRVIVAFTHMSLGIAAWSEAFLDLCAGPLDDSPLSEILEEGCLSLPFDKAGRRCRGCGALLMQRRLRAPGSRHADLLIGECPTCGPQRLHEPAGLSLAVRVPHRLAPGENRSLSIKLHNKRPIFAETSIAVTLRDRISRQSLWRFRTCTKKPRLELHLTIPSQTPSTLLTLRVTALCGLQIAHVRHVLNCHAFASAALSAKVKDCTRLAGC